MTRARITAHYERRVIRGRPSHEVLDWSSPEAQEARFDAIWRALDDLKILPNPSTARGAARPPRHAGIEDGGREAGEPGAGKGLDLGMDSTPDGGPLALLDVGCGLTDLCTYLARRQVNATYVGVDLSHRLLAEAHARHGVRSVVQADIFQQAPFAPRHFDAVVCSGALNLELGNNDEFLGRAFPAMAALARRCVCINFLHERATRRYPHCHYYSPATVLAAIGQTHPAPAAVRLYDDYLENDFTICIRVAA